jgi:hypothetical protein
VRPPREEDATIAPFAAPEHAAPLPVEILRAPERRRAVRHDVVHNLFELTDRLDSGCWWMIAGGLEYDHLYDATFTIGEVDPLSASQRCDHSIAIARGEWRTRVVTSSTMSADAESFHVTNTLDAYEGETQVFAKTWSCTIPRDLV